MEHVTVDDVDTHEEMDRRDLTGALGTTDFAINHYELAPGEEFSGGLHTHLDQEELFYVLSGTATFDVAEEPLDDLETVEVEAGEVVRFAPGEYQTGQNEGDEAVEALAFGAPKETTDVRVPGPCPECENDSLALTFEGGEMGTECPECGTELGR
ncbi:cupin domain-containing protein [Halolamina salifodinae]|uniref:Putative cupin superfamily protein n=1 Tax=Halolamina salifodinae TaxID=1202767 RepID=A0A8T4GWB2_9EURY|nr:cupin domain-containing protein [Halolamina salifodinae]MBP1987196.1 putative cupin superfamily protein [Halolamina salifodinae]